MATCSSSVILLSRSKISPKAEVSNLFIQSKSTATMTRLCTDDQHVWVWGSAIVKTPAWTRESIQITRMESFQITRMESIQITRMESIQITRMESIQITRMESIQITRMESIQITRMESIQITRMESIQITRMESIQITRMLILFSHHTSSQCCKSISNEYSARTYSETRMLIGQSEEQTQFQWFFVILSDLNRQNHKKWLFGLAAHNRLSLSLPLSFSSSSYFLSFSIQKWTVAVSLLGLRFFNFCQSFSFHTPFFSVFL